MDQNDLRHRYYLPFVLTELICIVGCVCNWSSLTTCNHNHNGDFTQNFLGPVVLNIVSLKSSLKPQLVKLMPTTYANTLLFFVDKM